MSGKIYRMYIAESAGSKMEEVSSVNLVAGKGIEGDRYFNGKGTFSEKLEGQPFVELSLIEKEEIDWFNGEFNQSHEYSDLRRSIVTENIRLNELVDKEFYVGSIKVKGIRLCEPCPHLAGTVNTLVLPHMVGKSGLRAQILETGIVSVGEKVG